MTRPTVPLLLALLVSAATGAQSPPSAVQTPDAFFGFRLRADRELADWYRRWKGTEFEGVGMPWLDHRYAGHDVNRDGFMMNLSSAVLLAFRAQHRGQSLATFRLLFNAIHTAR